MNKGIRFLLLLCCAAGIFCSCGSPKDILYFQDLDKIPQVAYEYDASKYEIRIKPNDNLLITTVSAINPLAVSMFNTIDFDRSSTSSTLEYRGYLVDQEGYINFPSIGRLQIGGLQKSEAEALIQEKIREQVSDAVVNIRFMNYKITVIGEVNKPGTYTIINEKVTIPEALALAGDMTINGSRKNVELCRVVSGEKKFYTIDMTSPEVFFSPEFFLQQNDILYVKPNKAKVGTSTSLYRDAPLFISSVSLLITILAFFTK